MLTGLFLMAVAVATPGDAAVTADARFEEVIRALRASSNQPLVRIEVFAVPKSKDLFIAICDTEDHWWGDVRCVKMSAGKIVWEAGWDGDEQSVLAARAFRDSRFQGPLIEVFGKTHMGHGNYYLYELQGKSLKRLVSTFAVDCHDDGTLIVDDHLAVEYRDANGDGKDDIELTGTVQLSADDGRELKTVPFRKTFLWDAGSRQFLFDRERSRIPAAYDWRE